jgi:AcrR family transcriptional regulator
VGTLATIAQTRGLPRGRASLPRSQVARAHRERLLRAITAAVAELGYANVRIADVVERARVSRQTFYAQFADKGECFLAAHAEGMQLILAQLGHAVAGAAGLDPVDQLRAALRAYLSLASEEPEFAHCMLIELQAIGPAGLQARLGAHQQIAAILQAWHEQARANAKPPWPRVPVSRYAAAVGAVHDLLFSAVAGDGPAPATLEDDAIDAVKALLQIPAAARAGSSGTQ